MNKKNRTSIAVVIINYITAILWDILLLIDIVRCQEDAGIFILHLVCAFLWNVCAVMWTIRYLKEKKANE